MKLFSHQLVVRELCSTISYRNKNVKMKKVMDNLWHIYIDYIYVS